jgi:diguanylate cyclase (GGDEF)-like protein
MATKRSTIHLTPRQEEVRTLNREFEAALESAAKTLKDLPEVPKDKLKTLISSLRDMTSAFTRAQFGAAMSEREKDREIRKLGMLATTDKLTGLLNRRGLEQVMEREMGELQRYEQLQRLEVKSNPETYKERKSPIVVMILIDLDGFKEINDKLGHKQGDNVLHNIAKALKKEFHRKTDILARIGGDELLIALHFEPNEQVDEAVLGHKVRSTIEKTMCWQGSFPMPVGASIGISRSDDPDFNEVPTAYLSDEMMATADSRMYVDKWGPTGKKPDGYDKGTATFVPPKDARLNALRAQAWAQLDPANLNQPG